MGSNCTSRVPSKKARMCATVLNCCSFMSITMGVMIDPNLTSQAHTSLEIRTPRSGSNHIGRDYRLRTPFILRGIAAINLRVVRNIFMSWIVTLPAGAILSIVFFFALKGILG